MKNTPAPAHPNVQALEDPRSLVPYLDARIFRALGDETRLAVLSRLAVTPGAQTVTEVASCCGVHISGVSRHLRQLQDAGLVSSERSGREVRYRLQCSELASMLRGLADALDRCLAICDGQPCCGDHKEDDHDTDTDC